MQEKLDDAELAEGKHPAENADEPACEPSRPKVRLVPAAPLPENADEPTCEPTRPKVGFVMPREGLLRNMCAKEGKSESPRRRAASGSEGSRKRSGPADRVQEKLDNA
jgi:hypothetical protein